MAYSPWGRKESNMMERLAYRVVWICLFHFYENDINILIVIAVKLYLALGSLEMSTIMSIPIACALFHSFSMVCSFQCRGHFLSKRTLSLASMDFSETVVGRMGL